MVSQMKRLNKEEQNTVYSMLYSRFLDLEDPCTMCSDIDCENSYLNDILLKRYRDCNVIDVQACLKQRKSERNEIMRVLSKFPQAHEYCELCIKQSKGTKRPKYNKYNKLNGSAKLFTEIEKEPSQCEVLDSKSYLMQFFYLCKRHAKAYEKRKTTIFEGYERM